jgi:hypothetical protein
VKATIDADGYGHGYVKHVGDQTPGNPNRRIEVVGPDDPDGFLIELAAEPGGLGMWVSKDRRWFSLGPDSVHDERVPVQ